jgi:flagellar biosynthesis protein FliP
MLKTNIVNNIPVHAPVPAANSAVGEDVELDKIMRDVGQELKKNVKRTTGHHLFSFSKKSKPAQAQTPAQTPARPVVAAQVTTQPLPMVPQSHQAQPLQAKPPATPKPQKTQNDKQSVPIFVILVTLIVTGLLVVMAVATYKQQ